MNVFLAVDRPELPAMPSRLYARFDDVHRIAGRPRWRFRFGCVDADWFDRFQEAVVGTHGVQRRKGLDPMPVSLLEMDFDGYRRSVLRKTRREGRDPWFELLVGHGEDGVLFRNLYAEGEAVSVEFKRELYGGLRTALDRAHSLDEWVVDDDSIQDFLATKSRGDIEAAAVYDVGQGTCVGLSPRLNAPTMYFDFGGGITTHTSTRPHRIPSLCLCNDPFIVLSHWDADHWSSAPLLKTPLLRPWIAPYQSLTPPQIVFAASISGTLRVSRAAAGSVFTYANAEIHRAAGRPSNRNNSGFFVIVNAPTSGDPFFFPGDADYRNTSTMPSIAAAIAATHHGGNWKSGSSPPRAAGYPRRAVFSFGIFGSGKLNTYKHPTSSSKTRHRAAGYSQVITPMRSGGHSGNGTGHVQLDWTCSSSLPTAPCGRSGCYQNLDQR